MSGFYFVILILGLIIVNVIAFDHKDIELRLKALEQNKVDSDTKLRELEMKLNVKEHELEKTRIDLHETKSEVEHLKSSIRDRRVSEPEPLAFHAELSGHVTNLVANQKIIFNNSPVNSGHAYNSQTGIFTCPQSGVYFFSLTILSFGGEEVEIELVVNGDDSGIIKTCSASSSSNRNGSGSNTVVRKLSTGDRVWPRLLSNGVYSGDKVFGYQWSTFTGFLVHST